MDLSKALESLKYDTRMREWMVKQGLVTKEDQEKNLKSLADSASVCEPVTLEDKEDIGD
jgi:hypothetical protein